MEIAVLITAVLVAGSACPLVMWWQHRRGRAAACCAPAPAGQNRSAELEQVRRSQVVLSARLAERQNERGSD